MKKVLAIFALISTVWVHYQNVEGRWKSMQDKNQGMEFKKDGEFQLLDLSNPTNKVLKNLEIKYELKIIENKNYIEFIYYANNKIQGKEFAEYRIEKNRLFLQEKKENIENIASKMLMNKEEEFARIE